MNRQFEQIVRPSLGAQLLGHIGAVDAVARGFARMAEDVSRRLDPVVRPSYFGTLGRASRQINEALRPRYIDSVSRLVEQMQQAVRPYLGQFAVLGRRLQQLARAPLFEALREF